MRGRHQGRLRLRVVVRYPGVVSPGCALGGHGRTRLRWSTAPRRRRKASWTADRAFQDTAARSLGRLPSARDLRGICGERTRAATTPSPSRASRSSVRALTERDLHHRRAVQAVHRCEPRCPSEPWLFDGTAASNDTA